MKKLICKHGLNDPMYMFKGFIGGVIVTLVLMLVPFTINIVENIAHAPSWTVGIEQNEQALLHDVLFCLDGENHQMKQIRAVPAEEVSENCFARVRVFIQK